MLRLMPHAPCATLGSLALAIAAPLGLPGLPGLLGPLALLGMSPRVVAAGVVPGGMPSGEFIVLHPLALGYPVSLCGIVVYDELCEVLLQDETLGHVSFDGLGDYAIGEHVAVDGFLCTACLLTPCGSPYSAILGALSRPCADPVQQTTWGVSACVTVIELPTCGVALQDDLGNVYTTAGLVDQSQVGLRFALTGTASFEPVLCDQGHQFLLLIDLIEGGLGACFGDLDGDGRIDGSDLGVMLSEWGTCTREAGCDSDLDFDGEIGGADLGILLGLWT